MKRYVAVPIILLTFLFSSFLYAENAQKVKDIKDRESQQILKNIREKDLNPVSSLEIQDKGKGKFSQEQKSYDINIGFDAETKKVTLKKKGLTLDIGLPHRSKNSTVKLLDGQIISSDDTMDIVTQSLDGGVRQVITIYSADADKVYDFPLTLPEGYTLLQDGSGNISVQNNAGNILSSIVAPWAKDANGVNIATHYEIMGSTLRQYIDFDASTIFPVVADPIWCGQTIASTSWIYRGGTHPWSLSVYPTVCGAWISRQIGDGQYSWPSWLDMLDKTPASSLWDKVYGTSVYWSMYDQFQCHTVAALGWKTPWNLEPTRPNVGRNATLSAQCNP